MSLDLANKLNCLRAGTVLAALIAWPATADLNENFEDSNFIEVYADTTAGPYNVTPAQILDATGKGLSEGDVLKFINVSGDNPIVFKADDGCVYDFADKACEFLCLKYIGDGSEKAFTNADFIVI